MQPIFRRRRRVAEPAQPTIKPDEIRAAVDDAIRAERHDRVLADRHADKHVRAWLEALHEEHR